MSASILEQNQVPIKITHQDYDKKYIFQDHVLKGVYFEMTTGHFMVILRKILKTLKPTEGIYILIKGTNTIPLGLSTMKTLWDRHKTIDGFLEIEIVRDNVFGLDNEQKEILDRIVIANENKIKNCKFKIILPLAKENKIKNVNFKIKIEN